MNHAVRDKTTGRFVKQPTIDWADEVNWLQEGTLTSINKYDHAADEVMAVMQEEVAKTPNDSYDLWLRIVGYGAYLGLIAIISAISAYMGAHWR